MSSLGDVGVNPTNSTETLQQAITYHRAGRLDEAIEWYQKTLDIQPNSAAALCNMGAAFQTKGKLDEAINSYQKAIAIKPDDANTYSNLGISLKKQGKLDEAINSYQKAVSINPSHPDVHNNLGIALHELGRLDEAAASFQKAVSISPGHAEAYNNLGYILTKQGKLDEAIDSYRKTLAIYPDHPNAHNNLGDIFVELEKLDEAITSFQKAIAINPGNQKTLFKVSDILYKLNRWSEAAVTYEKLLLLDPSSELTHLKLGIIAQHQGIIPKAVFHYKTALIIAPTNTGTYYNLRFTLGAACYAAMTGVAGAIPIESILDIVDTKPQKVFKSTYDLLPSEGRRERLPEDEGSLERCVTKNFINRLVGWDTEKSRQLFIQHFPPSSQDTLFKAPPSPPAPISSNRKQTLKMVNLLTLGRAGSGLFHSMLDGHPEISILPGVYMSGYFNPRVWRKITSKGFHQSAKQFAELYQVLFDSRSKQVPPPPFSNDVYGKSTGVGFSEGFVKLGENQDTPLLLDRNRFLLNLEDILHRSNHIDPSSFLEHIHHAYEKTLGNDFLQKKILLNHMHLLNEHNLNYMLKYSPDAHLLMILRNPIQVCESWTRENLQRKRDQNSYLGYSATVSKITTTLLDIRAMEYSRQESVGICLENIKKDVTGTMERLCEWLGISDSPTLYEATIQGLKWWGDPSSSLFGKTQTIDHGENEPIRRKSKSVFDKNDRLILETLFYPFSVRFGYAQENQSLFLKNLKTIRPLLEKPLNFEARLSDTFHNDLPSLENTCSFKYFHTVLLACWNLLNEHNTYPNMIKPLQE